MEQETVMLENNLNGMNKLCKIIIDERNTYIPPEEYLFRLDFYTKYYDHNHKNTKRTARRNKRRKIPDEVGFLEAKLYEAMAHLQMDKAYRLFDSLKERVMNKLDCCMENECNCCTFEWGEVCKYLRETIQLHLKAGCILLALKENLK